MRQSFIYILEAMYNPLAPLRPPQMMHEPARAPKESRMHHEKRELEDAPAAEEAGAWMGFRRKLRHAFGASHLR